MITPDNLQGLVRGFLSQQEKMERRVFKIRTMQQLEEKAAVIFNALNDGMVCVELVVGDVYLGHAYMMEALLALLNGGVENGLVSPAGVLKTLSIVHKTQR